MLPLSQRVAFLVFACVCVALGTRGFYRLARRIAAGRKDTDSRTDHPVRRIWYSLTTTLTQSRTFRDRPFISFLHSWIFYGFVFYLLVNAVDAIEGFYPLPLRSFGQIGNIYRLLADIFSALVLAAVLALLARRFLLPSRKDFAFNDRTLLHENIRRNYVTRDSIIVSIFILFHVGSRAAEMGSTLAIEGADRFQPFATLLSHAFIPAHAAAWRISGYWGALGSVLAFLVYFPYSKHIHIFMAPLKYAVARTPPSGILPLVFFDVDIEKETLGAAKLEDLAWPRLLDAYACIQCNRCQDVCPATATGKSLSPSALEINKRMELNQLAHEGTNFEHGHASPRPLLQFALTLEATWACTTCGACMEVCPVQDEPMLDIIDIRRQQVMMEGKFPAQLQTAFRGMERAKNPWGIAQENRLTWADGLNVPTSDQNPNADVLYWVGCAASYDPQAQKTARALVQVLAHAGVNYAVLGKKECCTGDTARRAGNEPLYQQLAEQNIQTLNATAPKLIIATCPHCMNALGKEYPQLGGNYTVMHHTEYLDRLVQQGKLVMPQSSTKSIAFHDPCYLGRHNDVYDAPRNLLNVLSNDVREMDRSREKSFCCGAGGAQFWKEEEPGTEKISDNRFREAQRVLDDGASDKVLAVGCPFCKSMLQSSPQANAQSNVVVMDIAELIWDSIAPHREISRATAATQTIVADHLSTTADSRPTDKSAISEPHDPSAIQNNPAAVTIVTKRQKWAPKQQPLPPATPDASAPLSQTEPPPALPPQPIERKKWPGKTPTASAAIETASATPEPAPTDTPVVRKKWPGKPKA